MSLFDSVPPPIPEPAYTPAGPGASAVLSPCGLYRYRLERWWGAERDRGLKRPLGWVMLNPSTADATLDDPTIRRCIGFAMAWGFPGLVVCNLFAWRATAPHELKRAADAVGPDNDRHLTLLGDECIDIVGAWGAHGGLNGRAAHVVHLLGGCRLQALGWTMAGEPIHPLYQPKTVRPQPWSTRPAPRARRKPC